MLILALSLLEDIVSTVTVSNNLTHQMKPSIDFCSLCPVTARSLRNVLHFLVGIGEVCNDKLGTPYKKCNKLFDDARDDCMELLSVFNFLCHIVDGFRPLCGLARGWLTCCSIIQ